MRHIRVIWVPLLIFTMLAATSAFSQTGTRRGGRYDTQIDAAVAKFLASRPQFKNIRYAVEDHVITVTGPVELLSEKEALAARLRRITHVSRVLDLVHLHPTPVPDEALYSAVRTRLENARFEGINIRTHEGRVEISGTVGTRHLWARLMELVWNTPGVREVEDNIRIAGD
ncbi:MAG: BON domain-containing protein [Acidobacteriales bacterium]|nr:BON domain-containing protein [Terriglobales bacterium]